MFEKRIIILDLVAIDKTGVLEKLSDSLLEAGVVKSSYQSAILAREEEFPTGLATADFGIAVPHTDPEHVNIPQIAFARLKHPVIFRQMGDGVDVPVQFIFMLALKDGHKQPQMLQELVGLIQNKEAMDKLMLAEDVETVVKILETYRTSFK